MSTTQAIQTARFLLEIDGTELGYFTECSGLGMTVQTEQIEEGGNNQYVHTVPGRITWTNIVLRHGVVKATAFLEWTSSVSGDAFASKGNKVARSTGAITAVDEKGARVVSWIFSDGFPVRWGGPSFTATGQDMVSEEVEIAHHGLRVEFY